MIEVLKPRIGDPVYYVLSGGRSAGQARAATVTNVFDDGKISLTCLPDAGTDGLGATYSAINVGYSWEKRPGSWHWPDWPQMRTREVMEIHD